jgi:DnaJ-class molecular chaperone
MNNLIRKIVKTERIACLQGSCDRCTYIKDGKGVHIVETYEVSRIESVAKCETCHGKGYTIVDCYECDGLGEIKEPCEDCEGKGDVPDESGELTFVGREQKLKEKGE